MDRNSGWSRTLALIGALGLAAVAIAIVPPMLTPPAAPSSAPSHSVPAFSFSPSPLPAPSIMPGAFRSVEWALVPFPDPAFQPAAVTVVEQRVVAVGVSGGTPTAWYSDEGSDWQQGMLAASARNGDVQPVISAVAAIDAAVLFLGRDVDESGEGGEPFLYLSADHGVSWAEGALPGDGAVQDILRLASTDDYFIAIAVDPEAEQGVSWWRSSDGQGWERVEPTGLPDHQPVLDLAGTGQVFIAVGSDGERPPRHPAAWISSDGIEWLPSVWGLEQPGYFGLVQACAAGYLLAGQSGPEERTLSQVGLPIVFVSPDGRRWSQAAFADLPGAQVGAAALADSGALLVIERLSGGGGLPTSTALRFWPLGTSETTASQLPLVGISPVALGDRLRWLRKALPIAAARYKVSDVEGRPLWEQATFDIEAKVVCATCNHGWMGDLESACASLLGDPILYGAAVTLTVEQQRTVACWAIKTAVVLETIRKDDTFKHLPEWHARWMPRTSAKAEQADPPKGISVVAFGRQVELSPDGSIEQFTVSRSIGIITREPPNDSKGYVSTFVVGYMGFQVFGVNVEAGGLPNIWYGPWVTERTTPLWPSVGVPVRWPPAFVMSTADVLRFADLWATT